MRSSALASAAVVLFQAATAMTPASAAIPIIGPDQRLSTLENGYQNGPSIVALGDTVVAVWFRDEPNVPGLRSFGNYGYSTDGGQTWTEGSGFPTEIPGSDHVSVVNPSVCGAHGGAVYAATRYHRSVGFVAAVAVYRGTWDSGALAWSAPTFAVPFVSTAAGLPFEALSIACDPSGQNVYLAYTREGGSPYYETTVMLTYSSDFGATWAPTETLGTSVSDGPSVVVRPDGRVTVVWEDFGAGNIMSRTSSVCGGGPRTSAAVPSGCPLAFDPAVVVAAAHDNVRSSPPGINPEGRQQAYLGVCGKYYVPNYPKLAVDRSSGPYQGSMYVVGAAGAYGVREPWSGRTVTAVEPNDYWSGATPIEIGDDFRGDALSPDFAWDAAEIFSFHGEQGTTVALEGAVTGAQCYFFLLYCGSDTTQLYSIGYTTVQFGGNPPTQPVAIMTLPVTGTYYLYGPNSGSVLSPRYTGRLRRLTRDPASAALDQRDIVLSASHDGGATWTAPVRVNDGEPWWDECLASVAVDGRGRVHVVWYGRTEGSECGRLVDVYWAISEDGGQTFGPSQRVSRTSSVWHPEAYSPGDVGEHLGIAAAGSSAHVVWTQAHQPDLDIFHARIDLDTITSTLLSRLSAGRDGECVKVEWEFGSGVRVEETCVYRSSGGEHQVACLAGSAAQEGTACDSSAALGPVGYRLRARLSDGRVMWFGPVEVEPTGGVPVSALRAHPNPFRGALRLAVGAGPRPERLTVDVLDLVGRRVARLHDGPAGPGTVELEWDGTRHGQPLPAGMYFVDVRRASGNSRLRVVKLD